MGQIVYDLTAQISRTAVSAVLDASAGLSAEASVNAGYGAPKDYELLNNKPKINGVVLLGNKSFEELGDSILSNLEIYEIMKTAGF